jgi:GntR family transcriptional regulator, transcriptional repressor for pyruvate dehydrogenase complex
VPELNSRSVKTAEVVADTLRRQIVRGDLAIGDNLLPEDELTSAFGIARTTLREALRILESEGLLTIRRGRGGGGTVTAPDVEHLAKGLAVALQLERTTIGDLDDVRQLLEPQLAGRLARQYTPEDMRAISDAIDVAAEAAEAEDTSAFGRASAVVHETLMERSGNRTLATLSRLLHELVQEYYLNAASRSDAALMQRAVRSQRKLINLIEEGNADAAEAHWREHMSYTIDRQDRSEPLDIFRGQSALRRAVRTGPAKAISNRRASPDGSASNSSADPSPAPALCAQGLGAEGLAPI